MEEKDEAIIYKITNSINSFIYIGETTQSLEKRFSQHEKEARSNEKPNPLYEDIRKYGIDNFNIIQVDTCYKRHKFVIEEYWCKKLQKEGKPLYNITQGASHSLNTIQRLAKARSVNGFDYSSEEFKIKTSENTRGEKNGMFNKKDGLSVNGRNVIAMNDNMEVVHTFTSVKMALKFLSLKGHLKLNEACRQNIKYKGYYWKKEWVNR